MTSVAGDRSFRGLLAALDPKERAFAEAYVECLNATEAARRVWGGRLRAPKQHGYTVLHRPDVRAAIDAGLRERTAGGLGDSG